MNIHEQTAKPSVHVTGQTVDVFITNSFT